ncbi:MULTISPECIES: SAM-dependent methyltransferase [Methylobacterium]|jgi:SAM-dependent methyltransferase|uniref:Methyltransferase type 12 n=2 Tax=Methylobacterium TaxID=407 RepID=A0A0C6F6K5_9HYPH|nr:MULTISPECIES: SAM-dependent methyltransferase [Methylobacterium]MBK3399285.1 methyltransferase domain-containing protein [Methylobacterium ajmalii]MBK3408428.1 methyltransferase domain-containing protein [Methylobacterium ajmalii]MBK3425540.1 methyltransferase domain-containing protein [Methylobacterium ajmalii]MBZ6412552.1 nodulation S family protein [Methylobacterium sp.]SFF04712.1 Nodulation protein S (NodS) [Methylobacterium sp. yr596]
MTRHATSLPPDYFDVRYAADPDPWNFAGSPYERDKYAATLAALPRERYASALEVGCSIGVLTAALAPRCDALVALDVAEAALAQARARCGDRPGLRLMRARVPGEWPEGRFDLILLSEVVYYLDAGDVARLAGRVRASLRPDGDVVLVHWTGETHYPLTGDEAADLFVRETRDHLALDRQVRTADYRLDVLRGRGG